MADGVADGEAPDESVAVGDVVGLGDWLVEGVPVGVADTELVTDGEPVTEAAAVSERVGDWLGVWEPVGDHDPEYVVHCDSVVVDE